ncbi:hypothetical protein [Streptomyces sp. NPDC127072]|uniref:hypothetical protein n=1 Tax=Streptomyces sp. NPDC127072 TaxID=3347129 RepID=UPI00364C5EA5
MGFREQPNIIALSFPEGHELHGLEATLKGMGIGEFMSFTGWDGSEGANSGKTIERFHEALISWNLEDADGEPIPVGESRNRPHRMIVTLSNAYVEVLTEVPKSDPLPGSSTSGGPSPAPPIPMTPVGESASQAS